MKLLDKIKILFTKSELSKLALIFLGILLMGIFEVVGVSAIFPFIAVVISPESIYENVYLYEVYSYFNFQSEQSFIVFLGFLVIVTMFITNLYMAYMVSVITYFSNMQCHFISVRLLENYLMQNYNFFLNKNPSELTKNILVEVGRASKGFIMQSLIVFSKLIITFFLVLLLILVNPLMASIVATVLGGAYFLIYQIAKRRLQKLGEATSKRSYSFYKAINQAFAGIKDIKLHSLEKEFVRSFEIPSKELSGYAAQKTIITSIPRYLLEVIAFGGVIGIIIALILITPPGNDNTIIPIISLYVLAGYRLMPALQQIYSGIGAMKYDYPALELIILDFENSNIAAVKETNEVSISFKEKLEISELSFQYENSEKLVLDKLNLVVYPNTTVGIVGSTGSGKTTLVDIILGLLIQKSGSIFIDGLNLDKKTFHGWQEKIGYVPQSIYLTDDTIEANIAFASPSNEIDNDMIVKAAKMANLHEFITSLPDQYKTFVGERGVRLSGGQIQRIGIARALYDNPSVLILDEATSSLDNVTENIIMGSIGDLSHKKTIIMIAHRLSTLKECDVIHFMNNGKVIESGTYEYLVNNSMEFKKMTKNSNY
jgi:ATP-binding cassette, subfamily B, bacterial PglK